MINFSPRSDAARNTMTALPSTRLAMLSRRACSDIHWAARRLILDPVTRAASGVSTTPKHSRKVAATRPLGTTCSDGEGAKIEAELSDAVNELGIGPQGLGGRSTAFRVHVEVAATHITMNPVAVNIQCHSARRANAVITPGGIDFR